MKLCAKILLLIMLLIIAAVIFAAFYLLYRNDPLNRAPAAVPEIRGNELFSEVDPSDTGRHFQRRTAGLIEPDKTMERYGLSGQVENAGIEMVRAVLPPDAVVAVTKSPELLDGRTAVLSGQAAIPASGGLPEKHCRFKVKVYILPGGGCEAAFPEFFNLRENPHRAVENQQ